MYIDKFKDINTLICIKTHTYETPFKGKQEYVRGKKYKCRLENNFSILSIEYPDGSGRRSIIVDDDKLDIRYFNARFITLEEHRKNIIESIA